MTNDINGENLKREIEEYVNQKGWTGFFGLLATISPQKIDQDDLRKYNEEMEKQNLTQEQSQVEHIAPSIIVEQEVHEASIYAPEHIPAVQDDLREQKKLEQNITHTPKDGSKARILAPENVHVPNPWGEAEIVSPGQLNL